MYDFKSAPSIAIAVATVLLLAACGGGGGGPEGNHRPDPAVDKLAFPFHGERQSVGVHQLHSQLATLPVTDRRGDVDIHFGTLNDGVGQETVAAYLNEVQGGEAGRFTSAPSLRIIGPSNAREQELVAETVEAINLSLPADLEIRIEDPMPGFSLRNTVNSRGANFISGRELPNTIHVEFLPCAAYAGCGQAVATTWAYVHPGNPEPHAYMQMARDTRPYGIDRDARLLLAHELLHALGIDNHVGRNFDSIMVQRRIFWSGPDSLLQQVDREALQALYTRLEAGDDPTTFGPWSNTSAHLAGNGLHANFGVARRNGYAEAWAHGERPLAPLTSTPGLTGTVTWQGALVGFSGARPVIGDAHIAVDLGPLTGTADFTDLESRGVLWGDGDLGYTIAVVGSTFHETGGDEGDLAGIFTGRMSEGAAGTLERADLTAAFGGSR